MTESGSPGVFVASTDASFEDFRNKLGESRMVAKYFTQDGGPHGYLVRTPKNDAIKAHFHRVDQFQLFYGASGARYKATALEPGQLMVHYADAYSTYGPIHIGDNDMDYFTLRARLDRFTAYMPAGRDELVHTSRHRNIYKNLDAEFDPDRPGTETIIEPDHDRLAAYRIRAGRGRAVSPPSSAGSCGQYYCILNGAAQHNGQTLGPRSLAWIGPDHAPLQLTADADVGLDMLVFQFPNPTAPAGGTTPKLAVAM